MASETQLGGSSPNPFQYISPLADLDMAIPRHLELQDAITYIRRNEYVSVLAPRQTGKTTFLRMLERVEPLCIYLDLERKEYTDLTQVTRDFAAGAGPMQGGEYIVAEDDKGALWHFLRDARTPKGRVFLIDELGASASIAWEFLSNIRAYQADEPDHSAQRTHEFVIAGSADLADLTLDSDPKVSPFNIAHELVLGGFFEAGDSGLHSQASQRQVLGRSD